MSWHRRKQLLRDDSPLLLLLAVGAALRFYAIGTKSIWLDEAFSIWLATHPPVELWRWLIQIDQHPPLYYTLLSLWQSLFGDLPGAVRAFSALCSTLTIPVFYAICRRLADNVTAVAATLILTLSPFHVRYAQEARMYALLALLVALALYLLLPLLLVSANPQRSWRWRAFGVAQAAIMLTHNTAAVFFPLALNLAIGGALLWHHWRGRASTWRGLESLDFGHHWLRSQCIALLGWLPWSLPFIVQSVGVDREFWIPAPTWTLVRETWHTFHVAFQPTVPVPWLAVDLLYGALFLLGCWRLRTKQGQLTLLLALCLVPIVAALLVSLRRPIFHAHILLWVTLPYYLLIAAGMAQLYQWLARHAKQWAAQGIAGAFLLSLVALNGQALHNYFTNFVKEEWDLAAAHVAANAATDDLLLFHASWVELPFLYYLRHAPGYNELTANHHGLPVDLFDRGLLEPKMTVADLPRLAELVACRQRVWLIYSHDWYTDPEGLIPRALQQQFHLAEHRHFSGVQVLAFVREGAVEGSTDPDVESECKEK